MPEIDINLKTSADLSGFKQTQEASQQLDSSLKSLGGQMGQVVRNAATATGGMERFVQTTEKGLPSISQFGEGLKNAFGMGAGLGLGAAAAYELVNGIRAAFEGTKGLVEEGVKFNAELENVRLGVAAALRAFDPDKYRTFNAALVQSNDVIEEMKQKSLQFGLNFSNLAEQYQATVGAMFKGGVSDLQKQIDLSVTLNKSMQAMGIEGARATRDIIDILNGVSTRTVAGRALGITDEDLKRASEAGQLYEFLTQKLGAFSVAVSASTDNVTVLQERLKNSATQVAAEQTQGLTDSYRELLKSLIGFVNSAAFKDTISFIAKVTAGLTDIAKGVTDAVSGATKPLTPLQQELKALRGEFDAFMKSANSVRSPEDIANVSQQGSQVLRWLKSSVNEAYAESSPTPGFDDAKALGDAADMISAAQRELAILKDGAAARIAANKAADDTAKLDQESAKWSKEAIAAREQLVKELPKLEAQMQEHLLAQAKAADPSLYVHMLESQKASLSEQLNHSGTDYHSYLGAGEGDNQQAVAQAKQAAEAFTLQIQSQIASIEAKITAEKKEQARQAEEAARQADEAAKKAQQVALNDNEAKQTPLKNEMRELQREKSDIEQNLGISQVQRQKELNKNIADYQAIVAAVLALEEKRLALTKDAKEQARIRADIVDLQHSSKKYGEPKGSKLVQSRDEVNSLSDPTRHYQSVGDGVQGGVNSFYASAGTIGDQAARGISTTLGAAVSGITNGIMGWINGVKSFGQAVRSIGGSVLNAMLQQLVNIGAQWLVNALLIKTHLISIEALQDTQRTARVAKENAAEASTLPLKTAGAAATGISSFGLALIFGVLAVGLILALTKGFADGGFTSPGAKDKPAGIVHSDEWVAPQWMVKHPIYGPMVGMLEGVRTGAKGYSLGGFVNLLDPVGLFHHMNRYDFADPIHAITQPESGSSSQQGASGGGSGGSSGSGLSGLASTSQPPINLHVYDSREKYVRAMQEDSQGWFFDMSARWDRKKA